MAKLSARGRTELHRYHRTVNRPANPDDLFPEDRNITVTYAIMSDKHVLRKVDSETLNSDGSRKRRSAGTWKDLGKCKSVDAYRQTLEKHNYVEVTK